MPGKNFREGYDPERSYEESHQGEWGRSDSDIRYELERSNILQGVREMVARDFQPEPEEEKRMQKMLKFILQEIQRQNNQHLKNETYLADLTNLKERLMEMLNGMPMARLRKKAKI